MSKYIRSIKDFQIIETSSIKMVPLIEDDIPKCYILCSEMPPPFEEGEYLFSYEPVYNKEPIVKIHTPNGIVGIEIDINKTGGFRNLQFYLYAYFKSLFAHIFIYKNYLPEEEVNLNIIKQFAVKSKKWNRERYGDIIAKIEAYFPTYSAKWSKNEPRREFF